MKIHLCASLLCLAFLSGILRADDSPGGNADEPLKILFIGNSFTYTNDMPHILQGLAASRGRKIEVAMHAPAAARWKNIGKTARRRNSSPARNGTWWCCKRAAPARWKIQKA